MRREKKGSDDSKRLLRTFQKAPAGFATLAYGTPRRDGF